MCGIAGIWNKDGQGIDAFVLAAMIKTISHRGPDDEGIYHAAGIGLAHRRLSIIDRSPAGHQPMHTPDGRYLLVFNGEIYNYKELREQYLSHVSFTSSSDTEVLLNLLVEQGITIVNELRGMFAFAWWDQEREELFLVRDPFGKKPLYYSNVSKGFVFASEVKALLVHPEVEVESDAMALTKYFLYEYVGAPQSGFAKIQQVPMGSYLHLQKDTSPTLTTYWQPRYLPKTNYSEYAALTKLDELLEQSVRRRMIADVPVGLLLSGGLDSTTIGWYMRKQSTAPLHAFSVSFSEKTFDELSYAREAAKHLGFTHHSLTFSLAEFRRVLCDILPKLDIPFADASLLPTYAVSQLARQHITVALDGDGSDELFGGYGTFAAAKVADRLPEWPYVYRALTWFLRYLPTRYTNFSWDFKIKSFLKGLPYTRARRNQVWLGSFSDQELSQLLQPAWQPHILSLFKDIDIFQESLRGLTSTDAISLLTINHYLQNDILVKLDRATMYTSLEARTPFLDVEVADFVMRLPVHLKQNKYLLKKLMRGRIPEDIIKRPKQGFGIPLGMWLKGPLYSWAQLVLSPEKVQSDGILESHYITRLLQDHRRGRADHRKKLWTLIMFQLWYDHWLKKRPLTLP